MAWFQARFTTQQPSAESLSDLLMELGAASVTFEDAEDQPLLEPPPGATPLWDQVVVVGLFDDALDRTLIQQQILQQIPQDAAATLTLAPLEEQDWVRAWMDDFHPMQFGERLWIVPSWSDPVDSDGVNILLDPGLAFGTGTHPTTALCLQWLDAHPPQGKRVIDYGCGSGILAIAAAKLGATQVDGVDLDPQALIATQDNAEKNQITTINSFLPDKFPKAAKADLLLANILAGPLEELAPMLSNHVISGGAIVLSGILSDQAEAVSHAYSHWFEMEPATLQEEWVRLSGVKR
ncbi:MAG: 50S ribosomal protein L11 methyltransferase [Gammaproteobacteria bacterium]|jgi:ribosomal protein L11 methyltransferase|nr:50S ribosomal protein L11 methyltransferase [Gammaproteobacteria bacterium]MBT4605478.1 50S ribosomal protein L11 methyltransferase [Thiotrichales bacterium]MBT3473375.1 50S ribosomal protein L11 methyltransferase [Gammaproteobacteria bacterium]MBT3967432.1 50S ribosomal protein L11 methyltransferase [Gammaproteobacteria bacterium]MBT4080674.1 50S ribosomal protein L11 methyltransferase [Gammaproteobacteria bacterium]